MASEVETGSSKVSVLLTSVRICLGPAQAFENRVLNAVLQGLGSD